MNKICRFQARELTVEKRAVEGSVGKIAGLAAVFNQRANIYGLFEETIAPGAFSATIAEDDIRALHAHDSAMVLGRNKSGSLTLREATDGLGFELDLPDTNLGRDIYTLVSRGDISGMSIGFEVREENWTNPDPKSQVLPVRTIQRAKLWEVSTVAFPAYEGTSVGAREAEAAALELRSWRESQKPPEIDADASALVHFRARLVAALGAL